MAETIHIELATTAEGVDLVEALARRGLTGELVRAGSPSEVAVRYASEETDRLLLEVLAALEAWLADRGVSSLRVRVGKRAFTFPRPERQS